MEMLTQNWAGRNWGTLFMPRVGDEVIVQFLEGDPDRPIIMGSVYNADNLPPYSLPIEQTYSGIKTHSTNSAGKTDSNELRFNDKSGNEEIFLHAQKDLNCTIENNATTLVINGNHSLTIQQGESIIEAQQSISLKVGDSIIKIMPTQIIINSPDVSINKV
jgi:type VI secretion system secreted protein VgrG